MKAKSVVGIVIITASVGGMAVLMISGLLHKSSVTAPERVVVASSPDTDPSYEEKVEKKAAILRKSYDSVRICRVGEAYEVWCTGVLPGKLKDAATLEEARKIVDAYYREWAQNCIGPTLPGEAVE